MLRRYVILLSLLLWGAAVAVAQNSEQSTSDKKIIERKSLSSYGENLQTLVIQYQHNKAWPCWDYANNRAAYNELVKVIKRLGTDSDAIRTVFIEGSASPIGSDKYSKDLNMLAYLSEMEGAGVSSFKIEGRMKSGYYLATVINAYRRFMDGGKLALSQDELQRVAHREYTTAYAFGENNQTVNYSDSQSKGDYKYIADVLGYENGYAIVEMRNRFKKGESLEILSPDSNFQKSFLAEEIYDSKNEITDDCKLVQERYKIKCPYPLKAGDFLRRKV